MSIKNATSGIWENVRFIWPIKDPISVNERRKTAGFNQTVEENANSLGIEYKIFTLEEILKLQKEVMNANE